MLSLLLEAVATGVQRELVVEGRQEVFVGLDGFVFKAAANRLGKAAAAAVSSSCSFFLLPLHDMDLDFVLGFHDLLAKSCIRPLRLSSDAVVEAIMVAELD